MTPNGRPAQLTAVELLQLYKAKELSPVEVVSDAIARIRSLNPYVNAYCYVDEDGALEQAKASEDRWYRGEPLGQIDGVPCSIKDLVLVKGMPTRKGSLTTPSDAPQDMDAPVTAHLREAGGIILGKTTTCEFGWKGVTDSPLTGITRNPWNLDMTPGGSSGGAAAAAALNLGVLHVGTDAGGSIRIPCAFTGTFGMKPSFGYVPQWPSSAMGTLSHLGPMTRTVSDSALMMSVIGRGDLHDFYCSEPRSRDWTATLNLGVKGLRIAYSPTLGYAEVDPEFQALTAKCARVLEEHGATVDMVDPGFADPTTDFETLWYAGAAGAIFKLSPEARGELDEGLLRVAELGRRIDILDYLRAVDRRIELAEKMLEFHSRWDLLLTPTVPITAFPVGSNVPANWPSDNWVTWSPYCHPFNMTQQPAASIPFGFSSDGLPVGVQLVGPKFRDDLVFRGAQAISHAFTATFPTDQSVLAGA